MLRRFYRGRFPVRLHQVSQIILYYRIYKPGGCAQGRREYRGNEPYIPRGSFRARGARRGTRRSRSRTWPGMEVKGVDIDPIALRI